MNLNSREIRGSNIKSLSNRGRHKRCCRSVFLTAFCCFGGESLSVLSTISFLFGCVVFGCLFALHSFVYSFLCLSFSSYCLCSGILSPSLTSIKVSKYPNLARDKPLCL